MTASSCDGLAVAMFAAETGAHLLAAPRSARFDAFVRDFDEAACLRRLADQNVAWFGRSDRRYPARLRTIHDPPVGLFVRGSGSAHLLAAPCVAIVGARACSQYGSEVAAMLAAELARAGVLVVSGLARGIDGAAHRGALRGGRTAAVLGCGIDRDYPRAHASLAAEIAAGGLILSEYAPGVEPAPWRFPARNRIVAGLADVTIVVEARERSGALITADLALEEGREVMAVPGEITSRLAAGTNALLRLGATPVTGAADVLDALGVVPPPPAPPAGAPVVLAASTEAVRALVADAPVAFDELVRRTGLDASVVSAALVELELRGLATEADGVYRGVMRPA
jgi:DNA processing protein